MCRRSLIFWKARALPCVLRDRMGHAALKTDDFDIALLDVTLAQGNGFAVCAAAREAAPDMPVIFAYRLTTSTQR